MNSIPNWNFYSKYDFKNKDGITINLGREVGKVMQVCEGGLGTGELNTRLKKMKTIWMMQLASFFYYGGLMYKKTLQMMNQQNINKLNVFLAGRGSQVIDWLPLGQTSEVLKMMIVSALEIDKKSTGIALKRDTDHCKMEAAEGMLKPSLKFDGQELGEEEFVFDFISGES